MGRNGLTTNFACRTMSELALKVIFGESDTILPVQPAAGWTGSIVSDSPKITFKANSDMVLHAKFVVSPFLPIVGTYNGLFNEAGEVSQYSSGSFSLTIATHGTY